MSSFTAACSTQPNLQHTTGGARPALAALHARGIAFELELATASSAGAAGASTSSPRGLAWGAQARAPPSARGSAQSARGSAQSARATAYDPSDAARALRRLPGVTCPAPVRVATRVAAPRVLGVPPVSPAPAFAAPSGVKGRGVPPLRLRGVVVARGPREAAAGGPAVRERAPCVARARAGPPKAFDDGSPAPASAACVANDGGTAGAARAPRAAGEP